MQAGQLITVPPGTVHGFKFSDDIDGWVISLTDYHLQEILSPAPNFSPGWIRRSALIRGHLLAMPTARPTF